MWQILAKISELTSNVTPCRFSARGSYQIISTQQVQEERERLLTSQDSHIITVPREDEDHDQLISRLIITNEIVNEQGLVIEIPYDAYHTVSTYPRENDNGSRGSLGQNSESSLVSTDAALKLIDNVHEQGLVIKIPDDAYHTVSTYHRENENGSRSIELNSQSSLVSTDAALQLVHNVALQIEDVGGQPKKIRKRASRKKKDKWIQHYCSSHEILLVGEGDFSFSVCLSKAFGSASKMIATSLDSESRLKEYYEDAMSNINHLKNNGCTILHGVDATLMASHPVLSGLKFDRIIYNFPLVGFPIKKTQLRRNRNLVLKFMKNAKELIKEDGQIHITHKSSTFYREWNLENLAKQNRLKLIEEVEFKLWHYPGYDSKYGFGGNENFECYPSKTYKFGLKDAVVGNVASDANPENACRADQGLVIEIPDAYHTVSTNPRENDNGSRGSLEQNSQSSLVSNDAALKLVDNVAVQKEDVGSQPKKNKRQASRKKEDKWIKHYCSSHEILLVGEGDFSFSVCLSKAFDSASKMIATSLDSESKLKKNYEDAMSNINHLKNNGGTILHELDATAMASHPVLSGLKFDRIIYNFPLFGFSNESKETQLKRNRNLVLKFMENAKDLIKEGGEIHITHKSNTSGSEWNLENLAKQNCLKLIEEVKFNLSHYPGYNNKYGFGGNKNFNCKPSKTYKFGHKDLVAAAIVPCGANQENLCRADQNKPKASPQKNALEKNALSWQKKTNKCLTPLGKGRSWDIRDYHF